MINQKYSFLLVVIVILSTIKCNNDSKENVIARVGKSVLTLENLKNSFPYQYSNQITKEQNVNYVKQWIDRELLYQEALNEKIDKDPLIKERLERMKKDLLSAEMLNKYSTKYQVDTIEDSVVNQYYKKNISQYVRDKDYVRYVDITVSDSKDAWDLYHTVNKSNFLSIASQKIPSFDSSNIPYTPVNELQSEIKQVISSNSENSISTPIKCSGGYHVIQILDKLEKGGTQSYVEVKKEIMNQLITEKQKQVIEKVLSDLRIKNRVDFNMNLISDSMPMNSKTF